jgi:hypothetical protein
VLIHGIFAVCGQAQGAQSCSEDNGGPKLEPTSILTTNDVEHENVEITSNDSPKPCQMEPGPHPHQKTTKREVLCELSQYNIVTYHGGNQSPGFPKERRKLAEKTLGVEENRLHDPGE